MPVQSNNINLIQGRLSIVEQKLAITQNQLSTARNQILSSKPVHENNSLFNMSSSDSIALAAAFVSLCALCAVIWQGYLTWKHNKLSVKPNIDVLIDLKRIDPVKITIKNHGLGPAIVDKIYFIINDESYDLSTVAPMVAFINKYFPDIAEPITHHATQGQSVIGSNNEVMLIEFCGSDVDNSLFDKVHNMLKNLTIIIEYSCVYGRKYNKTNTGV